MLEILPNCNQVSSMKNRKIAEYAGEVSSQEKNKI
jgi:mRNA-degrading endonuclease toxin of MazEF toxin-antitoxin module